MQRILVLGRNPSKKNVDPKIPFITECTEMAMRDLIVFGSVRPETEEKIDKMITGNVSDEK
jgi:hypothetical protein